MSKKPTYEEMESKVRDLELELEKRRSKEKSLVDSEFISNRFFNNSHDYMGIIEVLDDEHDLRYVKLNEAAGRYLGRSPAALQGMLASQIGVTEEVRCQWIEQCRKSERTGTRVQFSYERDHPDGTRILLASLQMVKSPFFSFVVTDITDFKQAEESLRESEEKYRQLFANASIGIGIADEKGKIIDFNNAILKPGEYTWKDITKINNITELYYNLEDRNRILALAQRQGFVDEVELQFKRKDGTPYDALLSLRPIKIKGKHCWQALVQDITERKHAQEALRKKEALLSNIFNSVQDGVSVLDRNLNIVRVNHAMEEWYSDNAPLVGKKCYKCYHNADKPCDPCPVLRCFQSGKVEKEIVKGLPGSSVEWIELYSYPMRDSENGKIDGVVEFVRNITRRKQTEKEREKLIDELQEALKEIRTLKGILPICSFCKKVRDDKGYWNQIESYIREHSQADISHGICPECAKEHYPDLNIYDD